MSMWRIADENIAGAVLNCSSYRHRVRRASFAASWW
jgi:hypothetical protein